MLTTMVHVASCQSRQTAQRQQTTAHRPTRPVCTLYTLECTTFYTHTCVVYTASLCSPMVTVLACTAEGPRFQSSFSYLSKVFPGRTWHDIAFSYAGPVVWNNLPVYIRAQLDIRVSRTFLRHTFLDSHLTY